MATERVYLCEQVGVFTPKSVHARICSAGEVGFIIAGIKELKAAKVGDTVTLADRPAPRRRCPASRRSSRRFSPASIRSTRTNTRRCATRSKNCMLNDASLRYEPEVLAGAGLRFPLRLSRPAAHGHRAGAARARIRHGPDHHRADRGLSGADRDGALTEIENPSKLPDPSKIEEIREPIITASILMPQEYVGPVITLCTQKRGMQKNMQYMGRQVMLTYELPLNEVVMDFFDQLKSVSRGYASLDYEFKEYRAGRSGQARHSDQRRAGRCAVAHRASRQRQYRGRELAQKMRELIPRQMFDIAVQAAIGAHIIARETVKALRKNVLAKCYGGDITRKRKLLEKQKAGKKRMKQVGQRRDSPGSVSGYSAGGRQIANDGHQY